MMKESLSEPYPIYTYRFFVHKWPELTLMAWYEGECIGCVVSKLENEQKPDTPHFKRPIVIWLETASWDTSGQIVIFLKIFIDS